MERLKMSSMVITREENAEFNAIAEAVAKDVYLSPGYRSEMIRRKIVECPENYVTGVIIDSSGSYFDNLKFSPDVELGILDMFARGLSPVAIAEIMGMKLGQVRLCLSRLRKLISNT